jgi:hypothetical protein
LLPFFKHKNYIKIDNEPLFSIYRLDDDDKIKMDKIITLFNSLAKQNGFSGVRFAHFFGPFGNPSSSSSLSIQDLNLSLPSVGQIDTKSHPYPINKVVKRTIAPVKKDSISAFIEFEPVGVPIEKLDIQWETISIFAPDNEFSNEVYLKFNQDISKAGIGGWRHYKQLVLERKFLELHYRTCAYNISRVFPKSIFPDGIFDPSLYLENNPDLKKLGIDGRAHFVNLINGNSVIDLHQRLLKLLVYNLTATYKRIEEKDMSKYNNIYHGTFFYWNNFARRQKLISTVYDRVSPSDFKTHLHVMKNKVLTSPNAAKHKFLFINAWNEWNEQVCIIFVLKDPIINK